MTKEEEKKYRTWIASISWNHPAYHERLMRMGRELRYELGGKSVDLLSTKEMEELVRKSFTDDLNRRLKDREENGKRN